MNNQRLRLEHLKNTATAELEKFMPDILRIANKPLPPDAARDELVTSMCMYHVAALMLLRQDDALEMEHDHEH